MIVAKNLFIRTLTLVTIAALTFMVANASAAKAAPKKGQAIAKQVPAKRSGVNKPTSVSKQAKAGPAARKPGKQVTQTRPLKSGALAQKNKQATQSRLSKEVGPSRPVKQAALVGSNRNPASSDETATAPSSGNALQTMGAESRAVEIRGQARTLSMMLVLKNGKENINFVKVRNNYRSEILGTEF